MSKTEIKKNQCLLFYLGYYVGEIDGVWGSGSYTATLMFQKEVVDLNVFIQL